MSDLKKITVTIKNYDAHASQAAATLYKKVRLLDGAGRIFYYKDLIVPRYLERKGAMTQDVPRTWFIKHIGKSAVVVVAFETKPGTVEYDLEEVRDLARSGFVAGIVYGVLAIPAGFIAGVATFGIGLVVIPMGLYFAYRNIFKIPASLSRKRLLQDLSLHGVQAGEGWAR
ncbi:MULTISPECIES: hypothetical protein [Pseudomonas syringae group]|uniref:hypothetical protein n=1 Tax=Pseudomonas syringae group TaxID=136849 RepID=UPI000F00D0AE|nr:MULTISPECIES: hypothetical protein [Pseudomonas syringae group]MDU8608718.1 hypothetical protein [Pseudomonas syringae group sp. 247E2]RMU56795.1 hypothetical protein ALP27_02142 [Pseudomonas savastanoi pv. glycinea]RMW31594.1 hypothetical protein ALO96_01501 [Pseudomonas savastanoi pv. glycinea]